MAGRHRESQAGMRRCGCQHTCAGAEPSLQGDMAFSPLLGSFPHSQLDAHL